MTPVGKTPPGMTPVSKGVDSFKLDEKDTKSIVIREEDVQEIEDIIPQCEKRLNDYERLVHSTLERVHVQRLKALYSEESSQTVIQESYQVPLLNFDDGNEEVKELREMNMLQAQELEQTKSELDQANQLIFTLRMKCNALESIGNR